MTWLSRIRTTWLLFVATMLFGALLASTLMGAESYSLIITAGCSGGLSPNPVAVGGQCTATLSGTADTPTNNVEGQLTGPNWSWAVQSVEYRATSSGTWGEASSGSYTASISQPDSHSPSATLQCIFSEGGYWRLTLRDSCSYIDGQENTWSGSKTTEVAATSVGIAKLQYKDGDSFVDVPGTIYVLAGTQVTFKALPAPSDASWPSGTPTWTGASGSGTTATGNFSSPSVDLTHPTVVSAACGTSRQSANVIVCDLIPACTPADNFNGRSTTRYGVGEVLGLSFNTNPAGVGAAQLGGLRWVQIIPASGSGQLASSPNDDGTASYTCPDVASTSGSNVTLQIQVASGPSTGHTANLPFSVVSPNDEVFEKIGPASAVRHYEGHPSCGFRAYIYLRPTDVSFSNCTWSEDACPAVLNGWFDLKYPNGYPHVPGADLSIGGGNINKGCQLNGYDQIYSGWCDPPPPLAGGTSTWNIPQRYKVANGNWQVYLRSAQQGWTLDSAGTVTIRKHNAGPYSAGMNDADSPW